MPAEVQKRLLADHYTLLEHTLEKQLYPIAGRIVHVLAGQGPLTLKQIADALKAAEDGASAGAVSSLRAVRNVRSAIHAPQDGGSLSLDPSLLNDAALKEVMTRLIVHRVVLYRPVDRTYQLMVGSGILQRVLSPLIADRVERCYGLAGVTLYLTLFQLGVVPWSAAVKLAQQRQPELEEVIFDTAKLMEKDGWIECVNGSFAPHDEHESTNRNNKVSPSSAVTGATAGSKMRKRGRADDETVEDEATEDYGSASHYFSSEPCRLNLHRVVRELFLEALKHYVVNYYTKVDGPLLSSMLTIFFHLLPKTTDSSSSSGGEFESNRGDIESGYEGYLPRYSAPISSQDLVEHLRQLHPSVSGDTVLSAAQRLCTSPPILERCIHDTSFRLDVAAAVRNLQWDVVERLIFVRHGTVGVRLTKLLLQNHFMDDKILAEEAIVTPQKTREVLHAMMKDGYTLQQEIPRTSTMAERPPKSSSFLWTCSMNETLIPAVRNHVARTLLRAEERLYMQQLQLQSSVGAPFAGMAQGGVEGNGGLYSDDPTQQASALSKWRNCVGLQSCSVSLMRLLFMMDYL